MARSTAWRSAKRASCWATRPYPGDEVGGRQKPSIAPQRVGAGINEGKGYGHCRQVNGPVGPFAGIGHGVPVQAGIEEPATGR